ncbi:tRNA-dihydrouridine synthase [Halorussus salilacus]|uniref:tRNA-dihydrouridine synthase n=1 Tax=Halorussus salilacus TaxID=2953750 RepID=UPI0020A13512|nr:tRNA-dihydrouridine synthase [Halorussus salilacus]USZ67795.1 tRNA-dihydrouridine synthase [Halorussus salilacus]
MFEPRVALASLSGRSDADWAVRGEQFAGAAFLGGIALDDQTREAARELVGRDREEFLPDDSLGFVDRQLAALEDADLRAGFNVRAAGSEPVREAARICADRDAVLEVNAHCRQDEMCRAGAGEALLRDPDRLAEAVGVAADAGATVSVKVRAEVPGVDLTEISRTIEDAGGDAVHVDAMDSEGVIADVAESADLFVIANNEVRDRESVREYLAHGADAVSVGRPSDDPAVLRRVGRATDEWFAGSESEPEAESEVRA